MTCRLPNCHIFGNVENRRYFFFIFIILFVRETVCETSYFLVNILLYEYDILGTGYVLYCCEKQTIIRKRWNWKQTARPSEIVFDHIPLSKHVDYYEHKKKKKKIRGIIQLFRSHLFLNQSKTNTNRARSHTPRVAACTTENYRSDTGRKTEYGT